MKETWTYNHKHLIVTISLVVALVVQVFAPEIDTAPEVVAYEAPCDTAQCLLDARTERIYQNSTAYYRELARSQAIDEIGDEFLTYIDGSIKSIQ